MTKKRCHFAKIRYCPHTVSTVTNSVPAFEVILWTHPEVVIEVTKHEDFPKDLNRLVQEVADSIPQTAIDIVEMMLFQDMSPPLIMSKIGKHIGGNFYVSGIGEEVRKTRDSAA